MEEMFEILNEDGTLSGRLKARSKVHEDGDLHGAVHMWIYRVRGDQAEILLQKRSECKDSWPGCYDISSAGHLDPGEAFIQGALREMEEELGLKLDQKDLSFLKEMRVDDQLVFNGKNFHNRELIHMYLIEVMDREYDFKLQESEVSEVMWIEANSLLTLVQANAIKHCIVLEDLKDVVEEINKRLRLRKQLAFLLEADKEKEITRQTPKTSLVKENDAEHAWHLALCVMFLAEHANVAIDKYRTMCMVLIHDLVEIDAGDAYAYDPGMQLGQEEREKAAADRIFNLLPADQAGYLRELWDEFEAWETAEAKFARSLDNLQPLILNHATDGISWKEHSVRREQPFKRNARTMEGSERIWQFINVILREHIEKGDIL